MPGDVTRVVEDTCDDHLFPDQTIEYSMPAINDATDVHTISRPRFAEIGEPDQSLKRVSDTALICVSRILAELLRTVSVDVGEVGARCLA